MTIDARPILENIISEFAPEKFSRLFREKSRQFAAREADLSRYNDDDFAAGKKQGEIKFSDGEQLLICTFAAQKPLSERTGKKAQYELPRHDHFPMAEGSEGPPLAQADRRGQAGVSFAGLG